MISLSELQPLVSEFGRAVTEKSESGLGEPEEQLRAPVEVLVTGIAVSLGIGVPVLAGESALSDLRVKPDFAVLVDQLLVGHIEVKAPGKGADTRRFREAHDKEQWKRLSALPNILYTDGNEWGLYREGDRVGGLVRLQGDVDQSGPDLSADDSELALLLSNFLGWEPVAPVSVRQLAETTARLCRLLRLEVLELIGGSSGLKSLQADWRDLLYPEATDKQFADQYAQTITFALLLARVEGIDLNAATLNGENPNFNSIAKHLNTRHGLIGTALSLLTDQTVLDSLATSVWALVRVLSVVDWDRLSDGDPDKWLLFYEDFLAEYDNELRKQSGSYYTPVEVVDSMVKLTDGLLRSRLKIQQGLASPGVTVVDPACGTGTFLFRVIDRIAQTVEDSEGPGAVGPQLEAAAKRLIGFELQTGPYSVAELRLSEEYRRRGADVPEEDLRLYVANTLDDPFVEVTRLGSLYEPIAQSRRNANNVKADEPVVVVIGNPPYKERSKGKGGWVESGDKSASEPPLKDFLPPAEWKLSTHVKHLYNPYVYFWRWASWKVFDRHEDSPNGIISFVTASGFLGGPGFAKMRDYLRRTADELWVIDTTPEGHQPNIPTRVFPGVQQPICVVIALKDGTTDSDTPAPVHFRQLNPGHRTEKFLELSSLDPDDNSQWFLAPTEWKAPLTPEGSPDWASYPALDDLFPWSGSGTMPGRRWVIGPNSKVLKARWSKLIGETDREEKSELLDPHPRDRTLDTRLEDNLWGYDPPKTSLGHEKDANCPTEPIAFRSFDRQHLIADKRVINQPNPSLWYVRGDNQVYLTAIHRTVPKSGPAITFSGLVPDLDHYHGRGGRVFPLWRDPSASSPNIAPGLLDFIATVHNETTSPRELFAYVAAIAGAPAYTERLLVGLQTPGLRVPLTGDRALYREAANIGAEVIWLHTYGERFVDDSGSRPRRPPHLEPPRRPKVLKSIPTSEQEMPNEIDYNPLSKELIVGEGTIGPVEESAWTYEVSGVNALRNWFRSRKKEPEGNPSSDLDKITQRTWTAEFTTELLQLINVLTMLADLETKQANLLDRVLSGPLISTAELEDNGIIPVTAKAAKKPTVPNSTTLL
ncbi:type ISP restriction/modification enzyme [Candidatus Poriferisocius sp.]|uniref:type ISP restriction/modification enzyme n=1 Tax=Candidatus Poriferisocius sp. TaxID=3101276 RepID=UPI003B520566